MESEGFYLGIYWGQRPEDVDQCADRVWNFISAVREVDPLFRQWRGIANRRQRDPNIQTRSQLRQLVAAGVHRDDVKHEPMEDSGYSVWLVAGQLDHSNVSVQVDIGRYSEYLHNLCIIDLDGAGKAIRRITKYEIIMAIMRAAVQSFDPDDGVFSSSELMEELEIGPPYPPIGWIVYLSRRCFRIPKVPAPFEIIEHDDRGVFIVLSHGPYTAKSRDQYPLLRQLHTLISKSRKGAPTSK